jgi:hypothetical protein
MFEKIRLKFCLIFLSGLSAEILVHGNTAAVLHSFAKAGERKALKDKDSKSTCANIKSIKQTSLLLISQYNVRCAGASSLSEKENKHFTPFSTLYVVEFFIVLVSNLRINNI